MSDPIFRSVEVQGGDEITLGQPLSAAVLGLSSAIGNHKRKMNPGTYGHAGSILIQLDSSDTNVTSINFGYDDASYPAMVSDYTSELGTPSSSTASSTTWQDSATTFTLSQDGGSVSSVLADGGSGA